MSFRNIRPLHILWQEGIELEELTGVLSGVAWILSLAGVTFEFELKYLAQRRQPDWHQDSVLNPYKSLDGYIHWSHLNPHQSLDWYVRWARINSRKAEHLNSKVLLDALGNNPTYETEPRYELVVVNEPLHFSSASLQTIGGIARRGQGAIISVHQHLHLLQRVWMKSRENTLKRKSRFLLSVQMLTMHELGHVFGLFPGNSKKEDLSDEELEASHCLKDCVMHFRENPERDKKIADNPFCSECLAKLKQFFIKP